MKAAVWILIVVLFVLHQDFWFRNDGTLLMGFLPIGLAWHIGLSIAAAFTWLLATRYAWPDDLDVETSAPAIGSTGADT